MSTRGLRSSKVTKIELNMIFVNFASLTESLVFGTHYLVMWYLQQVLIVLIVVWIDSGITKILCMTVGQKFMKAEVEVNYAYDKFS